MSWKKVSERLVKWGIGESQIWSSHDLKPKQEDVLNILKLNPFGEIFIIRKDKCCLVFRDNVFESTGPFYFQDEGFMVDYAKEAYAWIRKNPISSKDLEDKLNPGRKFFAKGYVVDGKWCPSKKEAVAAMGKRVEVKPVDKWQFRGNLGKDATKPLKEEGWVEKTESRLWRAT